MSVTMRRPCPLDIAMEICSERWTLQILHQLIGGPRRFGELMANLEGISKRTLSARLKLLAQRSLVSRTVIPDTTHHVEYSLTELGEKFNAVFEAMTYCGSCYVKYHMKVSKRIAEPTADSDFA